MSEDAIRYWAEDPYWIEALDRFLTAKETGQRTITLNLDMVEEAVFNGDGPA